jgi:hypothetical protein
MRAVLRLPIEQRTALVRRIGLRLPVCVSRFSNIDFDNAVRVALREVTVCVALQEVTQHFSGLWVGPIRWSALPGILPPWSVEEREICFVVTDSAGQQLAYIYFEDEPGAGCSPKIRRAAPQPLLRSCRNCCEQATSACQYARRMPPF